MNRFSFKSYLLDNQEYYQYTYDLKEPEMRAVQDIPFPESLTSFAYLEEDRYRPSLKQLDDVLSVLYEQRTAAVAETASELLMELGKVHIYFELFRLEWQSRLMDAAENGFADVETQLPRAALAALPAEIQSRQQKLRSIFADILDMDAAPKKKSVRIAIGESCKPITLFPFQPLTVTFEQTASGRYVDVLLPESMFELVDYHLRECLKQKVRMRVCRNCGKYFAVMGHSTAEYCNHPFDAKGRTCRQVASILQWTRNRATDEVFKSYRREYKKRFARMKAGTMAADDFYTWSEKAREKKVECEAGKLTREKFLKRV